MNKGTKRRTEKLGWKLGGMQAAFRGAVGLQLSVVDIRVGMWCVGRVSRLWAPCSRAEKEEPLARDESSFQS